MLGIILILMYNDLFYDNEFYWNDIVFMSLIIFSEIRCHQSHNFFTATMMISCIEYLVKTRQTTSHYRRQSVLIRGY